MAKIVNSDFAFSFKGCIMRRNNKKRIMRRKAFNVLIRVKARISRRLISYCGGLFDLDSKGYFTK